MKIISNYGVFMDFVERKGGLQAVHYNTMTLYSSLSQHQFSRATIGEIRWVTFEVALELFQKIEFQQKN